jgi:hypothetical protein
MDWIKRNMALVISGVVVLVALGGAGFYLFTRISADKDADAELAAAQQTLQEFVGKSPFPNQENVKFAKQHQQQLQGYLDRCLKFFPKTVTMTPELTNRFSVFLATTLADLHAAARAANVTVPTNFAFGFSAQKEQLQFEASALPKLITQVTDVRNMCGVLFQSGIYEITKVQRAPTHTSEDPTSGAQSQDILPPPQRTISTNDSPQALVLPYEVTFRCTSEQLAAVLDGLARSSNGIQVKWMKVLGGETENVDQTDATGGMDPRMMMMSRYGMMNPAMMGRYGMGMRRPPMTPQAAPTPTPTTSTRKNGPVIEDKPFNVTLTVEVIRLMPAQKATQNPTEKKSDGVS